MTKQKELIDEPADTDAEPEKAADAVGVLRRVLKLLAGLDEQDRRKVLAWVNDEFGQPARCHAVPLVPADVQPVRHSGVTYFGNTACAVGPDMRQPRVSQPPEEKEG
jgi:hypothetical protein